MLVRFLPSILWTLQDIHQQARPIKSRLIIDSIITYILYINQKNEYNLYVPTEETINLFIKNLEQFNIET